jgi:hypothetical protein
VLAVDPNRSTGVPLNPQFRNPPPGALSPLSYDDPVTIPAGDIADNPYWKRDVRRQYPRLSAVTQGDVVSLLTVGSKSAPKEEALRIGEAGQKQLATLKEEGESRGLSVFFEKDKKDISGVLGPNNMPPLPAKLKSSSGYELNSEQTYENKWVPSSSPPR